MSTKQVSTTQNAYNPQSLANYQQNVTQGGNMTAQNISNPYGNAQYMAGQAQGANASGVLANQMSGMAGGAAQAQMKNSLLMGAANTRNQAIGSAMNFRPLQTGGTSTQSLGGAGAWAAPVIGAGLSYIGMGGLARNPQQTADSLQGLAGSNGVQNGANGINAGWLPSQASPFNQSGSSAFTPTGASPYSNTDDSF